MTKPIKPLKKDKKLLCNYLTYEGIINGNDAYLYGEKVKAYLVRGARQLPGVDTPNPLTGDCVKLVLG